MKLIKLKEDHYIIVDDSEIKERDWFYYKHFGEDIIDQVKETTDLVNLNNPDRYFKKITHSTKPLNTDFSDWFDAQIITLQEVKELLGEVDVEKKANDYLRKSEYEISLRKESFIKGYNQALEDNKDKKHTEEDMRKIFAHGKQLGLTIAGAIRNGGDKPDEKGWFNESIESLQPKTEWEYVGECKGNNGNGCFMDSSGHDCGCYKRVPKTSWEVEFIDEKLKLKL